MPRYCAVYGCFSSNAKKVEGVTFHSFPKHVETRKLWINSCKRKDPFNHDKAIMCCLHFEPDSFERNLRYELLGEPMPKNKRRLKEGSIPTLSLPLSQGADPDNQRPGPSNVPSQPSSSPAENSGATAEQGKKGPATKAKRSQRKQKEVANVIEIEDEVIAKEHEEDELRSGANQDTPPTETRPIGKKKEADSSSPFEQVLIYTSDSEASASKPDTAAASKPRTSKRKRTSSAKGKGKLQEEDVEEKEDVEDKVENVKKLKVEEERPVEREEEEEEIEEKPDSFDMLSFQEIKIEEEDPLNVPYMLDDEANLSEAPDVGLTSGILFKQEEHLSWMDKTDKDKSNIAVAEEDSSKKENKSGQSKKAKAGSKAKKSNSKEQISKGLEEPHKRNRRTRKVNKQQEPPSNKEQELSSNKQQELPSNKQQELPSNKPQETPSAAEVTRKRCRKILREDSQSELSELSLQLTKDIYDVFGIHVAKTLRDINDITVFNRVKIKINDILLDALAGYYSNPGFERETNEGKQSLPHDHKISKNTDSSNQDLERKTHMKKSSPPNKDTQKTTVSDIDQTQVVSIDQPSSISQHSRIREPLQIINPPIIVPVNPSHLGTSQTGTRNTCQDSRTLQTTPFIHQPGTILVNVSFPFVAQSGILDNRNLSTTQSIHQPGTILVNSSLPAIAQSSDVDNSRTLETTQSIYQPGTILVNSSRPDMVQSSVLDPNDNSSKHSRITENFHGTDILAGDPNITRTVPIDSPSSSSQPCGFPETAAIGIDATQTSTVHPHDSISEHSGIPVTIHDKTHHSQVPGKKKENEADLNPLQS